MFSRRKIRTACLRGRATPVVAWIAGCLIMGIPCPAQADRIDNLPQGFPPLPERRRAVYEYYRLAFLPDGYPGVQLEDGRIVAHPLYGAYVINDYLWQYRRTKEERYLAAARKAADLALGRMQSFRDALVFWYEPDAGLLDYPARVYSALTQSYYMLYLGQLRKITGSEEYATAAERVLNSLAIATNDGGVLLPYGDGVIFEEVPKSPPAAVLNGWQTATRNLLKYRELTGSQRATDLAERSLNAMVRLLPLYDVPEVLNSRYRLSGFDALRWRFSASVEGVVHNAVVVVPGVGRYPIVPGNGGVWENRFMDGVEEKDGEIRIRGASGRAHVVLSMLSAPDPNLLSLSLSVDRSTTLTVEIGSGSYDPLAYGLRITAWEPIAAAPLDGGRNDLSIAIPWDKAPLVAYPTDFLKKVGGTFHNSYHFLHIVALHDLYKRTKRPEFYTYWRKWLGYAQKWPETPMYQSAEIRLDYYMGEAAALDPNSLQSPVAQ